MRLTEKQHKILRLALDGAAGEGEWRNAACALIGSMRRMGVKADVDTAGPVIVPPERKPPPPEEQVLGMVMPHGKHKDMRLGDIPLQYLEWMAREWSGSLRDYAAEAVRIRKNSR